jgi:hypothetical protein
MAQTLDLNELVVENLPALKKRILVAGSVIA